MNIPIMIKALKTEINFSLPQPVFIFRYKININSIPFVMRNEYVAAWKEISEEKRATTKLYPTNSLEAPVFVGPGPWEQQHNITPEKIKLWQDFWLSLGSEQSKQEEQVEQVEHNENAFEFAEKNKTIITLPAFYAQALFSGNPAFASQLRSNTLRPFCAIPEAGSFLSYVPPKKIARAIIENRTEEASFE